MCTSIVSEVARVCLRERQLKFVQQSLSSHCLVTIMVSRQTVYLAFCALLFLSGFSFVEAKKRKKGKNVSQGETLHEMCLNAGPNGSRKNILELQAFFDLRKVWTTYEKIMIANINFFSDVCNQMYQHFYIPIV